MGAENWPSLGRGGGSFALVWIRRVSGDFRLAAECFQQLVRAYEPTDLSWELRSRPEAALLAIEAGRPEEALPHLEICRAIIEQGEDWLGLAGAVERAEGVVGADTTGASRLTSKAR